MKMALQRRMPRHSSLKLTAIACSNCGITRSAAEDPPALEDHDKAQRRCVHGGKHQWRVLQTDKLPPRWTPGYRQQPAEVTRHWLFEQDPAAIARRVGLTPETRLRWLIEDFASET
jgi:hypothetical protein